MRLSVAIFAPGWVHEIHPLEDFHSENEKFWSLLLPHLVLRGPASLPILTSFCPGFGKSEHFKGKVIAIFVYVNNLAFNYFSLSNQLISQQPWFNLSKQQLQPLLAGLLYGLLSEDSIHNSSLECLKWGCSLKIGLQKLCYDVGFNGGGCLQIESSEAAIFP